MNTKKRVMNALQNWLIDEYVAVTGDEQCICDEEQMILAVGQNILHLANTATKHLILQELGREEVASNEELIELLLVFATRCSDCREYIQRIVLMDDADQKYLMDIIQTHSQSEAEEDDVEPEFTMIEPPELSIQQGIPSIDAEKLTADSVLVARLKQEVVDLRRSHAEKIAELNDIILKQANSTTDAELELLRKDQAIKDLKDVIQDFEKKNADLESQCATNITLKDQLNAACDELDILRPQAAKVDAAEAKNEMLKLKLEDLQNVKQQLKTEYENHTATFTELTALKQEAEALRKLKPTMETYRSELAELKITYEECRLRLSGKEEEILVLRRNIESLTGGHQGSLLQTQSLAEELRESQEQLRAMERVGGIGEGMSELNPALMQELKRLQAENTELLSKLDNSSLESLAQLEKNLTDAKVMNNSLQKKLLATKDSLELALSNIETLKLRLTHSQLDYVVLTQQFNEASIMAAADVEGQQARSYENLTALQLRHDAAFEASTKRFEGIIADISETLRICEETLSEKLAIIEHLTSEGLNKDETISTLTSELAQSRADMEETLAEHAQRVSQMEESHAQQLSDQKAASESQMSQLLADSEHEKHVLVEAHTVQLNLKKRELEQSAADLDAESEKRRKVERAHNFYKTETFRLKSQLQLAMASSGSGNGDVDTAMKEMKAMQMQLDEANAELNHLRALTGSGSAVLGGLDGEIALANTAIGAAGANVDHTTSIATSRPIRAVRVKQTKTDDKDIIASLNANATGANVAASAATGNIYGFANLEQQNELNEKKIEQLTREKREMLSKSLEESKEKQEISQKLLVSEKQVANLSSELRKLMLEKERLERRLMKSGDMGFVNDENVKNQARIV